MREDTLESLNTIGAAYRVRFDHQLLFTADVGADVPSSKVDAMEELERRGLRVAAVVDNEPENLRAMAATIRMARSCSSTPIPSSAPSATTRTGW